MNEAFGRYRLLKKIAVGGMAEVFLARHESVAGFQRNVVIKQILPEFSADADFVESFINEAKLAAHLNHPNIVQIYDFGRVASTYFIAMELITGYDLSTVLRAAVRAGTQLPLRVALTIFSDTCNGLHYAHQATDMDGHPLALVHRDVTPSNVLVSREGPAKIVDFGIAKATARNENKTKTGSVKGKTSYFSPEQILGKPFDQRVDVFACGILLQELITNVNPFRGETEYHSMENIVHAPPRPMRELRPDVPDVFQAVVLRALAKAPEERYPSCAELLRELEAACEQAGVQPSHGSVRAHLREQQAALEAIAPAANEKDLAHETSTIEISIARPSSPPVMPVEAEQIVPEDAGKRRPLWIASGVAAVVATVALAFALRAGPAPVAPAAPEAGCAIEVQSSPPGAQVQIDGVLYSGITPLAIDLTLCDADHRVAAFLAGYRGAQGSVRTRAGSRSNVALALQAEEQEKPKAAALRPALPPRSAAATEPLRPSAGIAHVRFLVEPWATVEIDGRIVGQTPLAKQAVTSGPHTIVLSNAQIGKRVTKKIRLQPGEEYLVRENLMP